MKVSDLIWKNIPLKNIPKLEPDPFQTKDAFYEALLLDLQYIPLKSRVILLFDARQSLSFDEADNVVVLICYGVRSLQISDPLTEPSVWNVSQSEITQQENNIYNIFLADFLGSQINIKTQNSIILSGYVNDIGDVAEAFSIENPEQYLSTIPRLDLEISISRVSTLNVTGADE